MENQQLIITLTQLLIWSGLISLIGFGIFYKRIAKQEDRNQK